MYIEEIPSGVRTITGVATSLAAFLGRTVRGDIDEPTLVNSFADFERTFGGLAADYPLSYAVRDFYLNGGSQAIVVRAYKKQGNGDGAARVTAGGLTLAAASPGEWGKKLRLVIDTKVSLETRAQLGLGAADALFNLTVFENRDGGAREQHRNLTVKDGPRRLDNVLKQESSLLRWPGTWPPDPLPTISEGSDAASTAEAAIPAAKKALEDAQKATPPVQTVIDAAKKVYDDAVAAVAKAETDGGAANSAPLDATALVGSPNDKTGLRALDKADLFNLLCIPPDKVAEDTPPEVYQAAMQYCFDRRAMLLVDSPAAWGKIKETAAGKAEKGLPDLGLAGTAARNAALYFPRVLEADPFDEGRPHTFVPCGIVAGVMARTDTQRGVWKAPAGLDAALNGVQGLEANLNDLENGQLNPLGINCLRSFPVTGRVVWGARTLRGADQLADEYKYVPVRRLALFLEESLYRGTQWVVFEPNDEPLWAQIRLNIGAFMNNLFRQGAFQGTTPREAYFVKCDKETTTQNDINLGVVNIVVGFRPLKPAEFVVLKIQQMAGQIDT